MKRSALITFAGIDGSGKTSTARIVAETLRSRGVDAEYLEIKRPAWGNDYVAYKADLMSRVLWAENPDEPLQELGHRFYHLMHGAWFELIDHRVVKPALAEGRLIVADNWYWKAWARASLREPDIMPLESEVVYGALTEPSLTFLLDINPELAVVRRGELGRTESGLFDGYSGGPEGFIAYQSRVRAELSSMSQGDTSWHVIDSGATDQGAVVEESVWAINEMVQSRETEHSLAAAGDHL